jgi:hypothetical protein
MAMDWNILAGSSRHAALLLVRQRGKERSAISRAYYAAYSRTMYVLSLCGVTTFTVRGFRRGNPLHVDLPALVEKHLQLLGKQRRDVADALRVLYHKLRVPADYKPLYPVDVKTAEKAVDLMTKVFDLTRDAVEQRSTR